MNCLRIEGSAGCSDIHLDAEFEQLAPRVTDRRSVIVTDENVFRHHQGRFPLCEDVIVLSPGEDSKTLLRAGDLLRRLVQLELDRSSLLIGIGGGVVTDLAGFVASVFLRGIPFGFVATTVLGQVDAAIGGKNGVNVDGYKNLVGVIRQPGFVLNVTSTLSTLPRQEVVNGMSEVIKSGLIADADLFETLEEAASGDSPLERLDMGRAISSAAAVKVHVVNRDVYESGERRHLNFGHTLGHALEKMNAMPHGFAVAVGMVAAARISHQRGMLTTGQVDRILHVISAFGLPVAAEFDIAETMDAIRKDKKREREHIQYVLLSDIGKAEVQMISFHEIREALTGGLL